MFLGYNFSIMKRYWPLFAIAVMLATVVGMSQYADSSKHRYEESTRQTKATPIAKCDDGYATNNAKDAYKPPVWAKFVTWPESVGAWAVILTLLAIAWQSIETREAATAANRSIEINKTKERAKLLLHPCLLNPKVGVIPQAQFNVTNVGASSAFFGIAMAGLHISDSHTLAEHGSGYYRLRIGGSHLKEGGFSRETTWWPAHMLARFPQSVIDGQEVIHLHGIMRFRDDFDDWWELKFHYIWQEYGREVWIPHLQENRTGEWKNQNPQGEKRIATPSKKRWWQFWKKIEPLPEQSPN
jgi:hypothetical protein